MKVYWPIRQLASAALVATLFAAATEAQREVPFERTEKREDCTSREHLRQPFFGATHLHTGLSFDASIRFVPPTPRDAYRFAKGEAPIVGVDPAGNPTRRYWINRPLDWGAVTDHSEHFGEMGICKDILAEEGVGDPEKWRYSLDCQLINGFYWQPQGTRLPAASKRDNAKNAFSILVLPNLGPSSFNTRLPVCVNNPAGCATAELAVWEEMQAAAEEAYDRTSSCRFTSFIGYEVTSTPGGTNWHRNVIFRNADVVPAPITAIHMAREPNPDPQRTPPKWLLAPDVAKLWSALNEQCLEADNHCDVITIPHNSNLGGGVYANGVEVVPPMFNDPDPRDPKKSAAQRQLFEPLVEIYQDKGSSECRWDPRWGAGVDTNDELCDFELLDSNSLLSASGVGTGTGQVAQAPPLTEFPERSYVRNVLKDGLTYQQRIGVNPFKLGIVASSDSHNGTMGWHPENAKFGGHLGIEDADPTRAASTIQNSSGGHSVVWAEENSRDSIFEALKRKETYGTSGTRPIVRFFGGWDLPEDLCNKPHKELAETGYRDGVPMGGDLPERRRKDSVPRFAVAAWMDDFIGTPLQRVDVIKGWVDQYGTHERVFTVAGGPSDAGVDPETCERVEPTVGKSYDRLCAVFKDETFDPTQPAFYYVRVLENPVCRYSTHICQEGGVNPLSADCGHQLRTLERQNPSKAADLAMCCSNETTAPYVQPVIQERAWTSPIWYTPPDAH